MPQLFTTQGSLNYYLYIPKVVLNNTSNLPLKNAEILMGKKIPHAHDLMPGDLRVGCLKIIRQMPDSLTNNFDVPNNGVKSHQLSICLTQKFLILKTLINR